MIRLAMLSFWHVHAGGYARQAQDHPETELVACWDEDPERGRAYAEKLGLTFHSELTDVLARDDVDGVIVDAPTNIHPEVLTAAAHAGKHIFTEKVLALTTEDCADILHAVEQAGVTLVVSLPRLYDGYTLAINELLARGDLGDVTLVRVRLSHGGALGEAWLPPHFFDAEQCGGGALVDLGCHPMYLARAFLGSLPTSVSASFGHLTGRTVEDNAVAVLRCANGALGVVETGFVNQHSPFTIEVHGTEGTVFYGFPTPGSGGSTGAPERMVVRSPAVDDGAWSELPIPENDPTPFAQFVSHIQDGTTATDNIAAAVDLTRLMAAANQSAADDTPVRMDGR